jgi:murein DD-endopeptidase MepM/ murein hydrolase activator NlpD
VAGSSSWSNDWHAYRACPYPHLHQGLDIFAASGTPVVAAENAVVTQIVSNAISGLAVEIRDRDGIEYFYAHLSAFSSGLHRGQPVRQGQVLGFVGTTGNALGSSPHLHFEIQPGGQAMPPKPVVDRWLLSMVSRARLLVAEGEEALQRQKSQAAAVSAIGLLGDTGPPGFAAALARQADQGLGLSPMGPAAVLVGIVLVGLALELLRYRGRRHRPHRRRAEAGRMELDPPDVTPPGPPKEAATVSMLGLGVIVVLMGMTVSAARPHRRRP